MIDYTAIELMIMVAARELEDNSVVIVGSDAPCATEMLAQKTHSPNMTILFEAGGIGSQLPIMPISVGDSKTFYRGLMAISMDSIMSMLQRGAVDTCFIGGAQIDMNGNINSTVITVIGDYYKPKIRFPGSGGANDLASLCWKTICMILHLPERFVQKVDFLTSPGFIEGYNTREKAGLLSDTGPICVKSRLLRIPVLSYFGPKN